MIENGFVLMAAGMGTVGAFLTTMIFAMHLSAVMIHQWFPEKEKATPGKSKPKTVKSATTAEKVASVASTGKSEKKASSDAEAKVTTEKELSAKAS